MTTKRFKVNIELHSVGDGRMFLNFWNGVNGDDVVCQTSDGNLFFKERGEDGEVARIYAISIGQFIEKVVERVEAWD